MYVYVHSFALALVALHCNPSDRPCGQSVEKDRHAALTAASGSVMYVYVHSLALSLVALPVNLFEHSGDRPMIRAALLR